MRPDPRGRARGEQQHCERKRAQTRRIPLMAMLVALHVVHAQPARVVTSVEPPLWGTTVRLVRELHIGEFDGDERYLFGRIRNVAIGKGGAKIGRAHV